MQPANLATDQLRAYKNAHLLDLLRARYVPDPLAAHELRSLIANGGHEDEASIALCRALLAPVRQLPPEILERIFSYSTAPQAEALYERAPTLWLGRVCKVWRDVVAGTFDLSTCITLPLKEPVASSSSTPSKFESLQTYLQTYPFSPLHVQLQFGTAKPPSRHSPSSYARHDELEAYIPLIMPHQHRWCKLEVLDTDRYDVVPAIRQFFQMAFRGGAEPLNGDIPTTVAKTSASKIRDLVLISPSYSDFIPQPFEEDSPEGFNAEPTIGYTNPYNLPWTTLTSLSIRCSALSIPHLLELCSSLQTFNVLVDLPNDTATTSIPPRITSSSIREFGLIFNPYCGDHVLTHLLSTISLPSLTSLAIESNTDNTHPGNFVPTAILKPFLAQSPDLHHLRLKSSPIYAKVVLESLVSVPNLQELDCDFTAPWQVDRLAEGLCLPATPRPDTTPLVPRLTSLKLGVMHQSAAIRVSSVVRSRAYRAKSAKVEQRTAAMKKVTIVSLRSSYSWVQDLERELKGLGLEVRTLDDTTSAKEGTLKDFILTF